MTTPSQVINSFEFWTVVTSLVSATSIALLLYGSILVGRRRAVRQRLVTVASEVDRTLDSNQAAGSQCERALARIGQLTLRALPAGMRTRLQLATVQAGLTGSSISDVLLTVRLAALLMGGGLAYTFATSGHGTLGLLGAAIIAPISAFGVDLFLRARAQRRRRAAEHDLPTVLDLLTLTLAAGMGFDNALEMILDHFRGPLVDELARYLVEIRQLGARRGVALRGVAVRLGDPPDLVDFIDAVNRAQMLGTGLLAAVESQVILLRQERHRRVASAAQRAPIRMLIPMTLFMLPVLMLIVIAPVGLRVLNSIGGLH